MSHENTRLPVTITCGESRTKAKTGMEHDINKIVAKAQKNGMLPMSSDMLGQFIDVAEVGDFTDCQNRLIACRDAFYKLPSKTRMQFNNDIDLFMNALTNSKGQLIDQIVQYGLTPEDFVKNEPVTEPKMADNKPVTDANKGGDK